MKNEKSTIKDSEKNEKKQSVRIRKQAKKRTYEHKCKNPRVPQRMIVKTIGSFSPVRMHKSSAKGGGSYEIRSKRHTQIRKKETKRANHVGPLFFHFVFCHLSTPHVFAPVI